MRYSLEFNPKDYTVHTLTIGKQSIEYRAYENIVYVANPVDINIQYLNIYVPESYYKVEKINQYTAATAPIFLPNTVGGYMPGVPQGPDKGRLGNGNAAFFALTKGCVVVIPGVRGRELQDETQQRYTGVAPAAIVDLKAAVRYLRYNSKVIPGDTEKIISNGTSAGGALSALLGVTGNHPDYEIYLDELGAARERDDIFAASCYCPITNLENADAAYEWMYNGLNEYKTMKFEKVNGEVKVIPIHGQMTEEQIALSNKLKQFFPNYLNNLGLENKDGENLVLDENGEGTFKEYVKSFVINSALHALENDTDLSQLSWLKVNEGKVTDLDYDQFVQYATRMKPTLAFDDLELRSPENELFGTALIKAQHFTSFAKEYSKEEGTLANEAVIKLMNPMDYIGNTENKTTSHWRIRHGAVDRDTSLAIPIILATKLMNEGYNVDFALPWGQGHGGDYDLDELFAWIEDVAAK